MKYFQEGEKAQFKTSKRAGLSLSLVRPTMRPISARRYYRLSRAITHALPPPPPPPPPSFPVKTAENARECEKGKSLLRAVRVPTEDSLPPRCAAAAAARAPRCTCGRRRRTARARWRPGAPGGPAIHQGFGSVRNVRLAKSEACVSSGYSRVVHKLVSLWSS